MTVRIHAMATAQPTHRISQNEAAALAGDCCCVNDEQHRLLSALYRRTRVRQRGSVLLEGGNGGGRGDAANVQRFFPAAATSDDRGPSTGDRMGRFVASAIELAVRAGGDALARAGASPSNIADLVVVSCTGFESPGVDIAIIRELGLPDTTTRTQIGFMGCHGALNGLRTASALAAAKPTKKVLLVAVELCSIHFQYGWDPEQIVANALFADGAAAVVLGAGESGESGESGDSGGEDTGAWSVADQAAKIVPDSLDAMTWRIGDHGFEMTLASRVPELIRDYLPEFMEQWLSGHGLAVDDVASWAVHPGGPRIVQTVRDALDLPPDATEDSMNVLAECGNMSSPTVLFILERLMRRGAKRPCVAMGFGPGLAIEAALLM